MLTKNQISQIREHLDKAQNPVFFFDNDADGLCSFLILQRYIGRGKGVAIRSFPEMTSDYFRKVDELGADYIFILDKPVIDKSFFDEVEKYNVPTVWIDHHDVQVKFPKCVDYYNPLYNKPKKNVPVTALCYEIAKKKDTWLAVAGSVSDHYYPEFYKDFQKEYPELCIDSEHPFDIFYNSGIGKIARILGFGLKNKTTEVVNMMKFLMKAKGPYDVLDETGNNKKILERFSHVDKRFQTLFKKAKSEISDDKILFFQYGGDLSISADLSNKLCFEYPDKVIVVIYITGAKANISIRGDNIRDKVLKVVDGIDSATGGGHENAVGSKVAIADLDEFKKRLRESVAGQ